MIDFSVFSLKNGLTVIHHQDTNSKLCVLNLLYKVGSKNEDPEKTGFAHLFEHLMFGGSVHVKDFDTEIQLAGGDNNAFTSNGRGISGAFQENENEFVYTIKMDACTPSFLPFLLNWRGDSVLCLGSSRRMWLLHATKQSCTTSCIESNKRQLSFFPSITML